MKQLLNVSYCNFFFDGLSNATDKPCISGELNISWPRGWTQAMADKYRKDNGLMMPRETTGNHYD